MGLLVDARMDFVERHSRRYEDLWQRLLSGEIQLGEQFTEQFVHEPQLRDYIARRLDEEWQAIYGCKASQAKGNDHEDDGA